MFASKSQTDAKYTELKEKHDAFVRRYKKFIDDNRKYLNTSDIPTYFLTGNLDIQNMHTTTDVSFNFS